MLLIVKFILLLCLICKLKLSYTGHRSQWDIIHVLFEVMKCCIFEFVGHEKINHTCTTI